MQGLTACTLLSVPIVQSRPSPAVLISASPGKQALQSGRIAPPRAVGGHTAPNLPPRIPSACYTNRRQAQRPDPAFGPHASQRSPPRESGNLCLQATAPFWFPSLEPSPRRQIELDNGSLPEVGPASSET